MSWAARPGLPPTSARLSIATAMRIHPRRRANLAKAGRCLASPTRLESGRCDASKWMKGARAVTPKSLFLAALCGFFLLAAASAQEVLPRPEEPFRGKIGL